MAEAAGFEIERAFRGLRWLLGRDFPLLVKVFALWTIVTAVAWLFMDVFWNVDWPLNPIFLISDAFFAGALTLAALSNGMTALKQVMAAGRARLMQVTVLAIATSVIVEIGFMALFVPGLVLGTLLSLVLPVHLNEGAGFLQSFQRSWQLVWRRFWPMAGFFAIVTVLTLLALGFALYMLSLLRPVFHAGSIPISMALVIGGIVAAYTAVAAYLEATYTETVEQPG